MTALDYEDIKSQVSIVSVLAQYAPVPDFRRSRFRMPCPLHNGDRDNFLVNEDEGNFYCFVCKKGGDVINLVATLENISNHEAAKKIAEQQGILSRSDKFLKSWKKTHRVLEWMADEKAPPPLTSGQIPQTEPLYSYRHISPEAIEYFGLRLIPGNEWGSGIYIPIRTIAGDLVGYSIRMHDSFLADFEERTGKKAPKYLNSEGLKKQGIMFGLAENREAVIAAGFVYLVEGQFDCISVWDRGIHNVIAAMGSSLSIYQVQQLMSITSRLVLVFDGDEAGQRGMAQIKQRFESAFNIKTIHLPEGCDPATVNLGDFLQ